ncbi:MAG: glucosyl-3-phosphoglycerate synthase [Acidimicrobiaceae bacterium]|nr:glucosyl-3-phosphoglycerate synthase [Acidimicrobiaceae bacterium]
MLRSFDHREFPLARLIEAKRGRTISVCLPARNEAATVGQVVKAIRTALMVQAPLVDELIVVDDGSTDATAAVARAAGADVVAASAITPDLSSGGPGQASPGGTGGPAVGNPDGTASPGVGNPGGTGAPGGTGQASPGGKGQAMWKAVHVSNGDLVVFCDADIRQFAPHFITGLLGPLLCRDDVVFVKGFYERPLDGRPAEGGRVTELVARPLIAALLPHLAAMTQPLAGEYAARREVFEEVPFVDGYGVDLGLVIDVAERWGVAAMAQCDLGERIHRNRPLSDLGPQALAVVQVALSRAGLAPQMTNLVPWQSRLVRPGEEAVTITLSERPALASVAVEAAQRKTA